MLPCTTYDFEHERIYGYNVLNKFCPDWINHSELLHIMND
jgi:hypothetical protein